MKKIVNTSKGFTLAEILISLMILGVIASLTIPSLIQNTQKKEQVVQVKKALSVINQAIAMDYALTGKDLSNYDSTSAILDMLKKRISITDTDSGAFKTVDGSTFYIEYWDNYNEANDIGDNNNIMFVYYTTQPLSPQDVLNKLDSDGYPQASTLGNMTGWYRFNCGKDRCVPSSGTAAILNATDPTKS